MSDDPSPGGHTSPTAPAVLISDRQSSPVDVDALAELARRTLLAEGLSEVELSLSFVDEAEMEDLHVRYLDEPGPTDALPADPLFESKASRIPHCTPSFRGIQ